MRNDKRSLKTPVVALAVLILAASAFAQVASSGNCSNGTIRAVSQPFASQCLGQPERASAGVVSDNSEPSLKVTGVTVTLQRTITQLSPPTFADVGVYFSGPRTAVLPFQTFEGGTITWNFSGSCGGLDASWTTTQTVTCPPVASNPTDPCLDGATAGPTGSFTSGGGDGGGGPAPVCSPIILDTTGEGFHLTSADAGVRFDIRGDGHPTQLAWTAPSSRNAFLALDRNGNGTIDDGTELFGNFTAQPKSAHPNGFLALAEFDKPENGGNGDGILDENDAVFSHLVAWIDENHDGISQPNELHRLLAIGIYSINLNYKESRRTDEFGNVFRYRAKVNAADKNDQSAAGRMGYDVFLQAK